MNGKFTIHAGIAQRPINKTKARNLYAYSPHGQLAGVLHYREQGNTVWIVMMETEVGFRRQGVGAALLLDLRNRFPDATLFYERLTEDGKEFFDSATAPEDRRS